MGPFLLEGISGCVLNLRILTVEHRDHRFSIRPSAHLLSALESAFVSMAMRASVTLIRVRPNRMVLRYLPRWYGAGFLPGNALRGNRGKPVLDPDGEKFVLGHEFRTVGGSPTPLIQGRLVAALQA